MATTTEEVQRLREENAVLRAQIAWLKQQLFGPGKSETLDRAQLLLQLGALEKLVAPRPVATITYERPTGPAPRRTLPAESFAHLPVKETVELVPEPVRQEPELYERIGEERTFEVDVVPPQLFKREFSVGKERGGGQRDVAGPVLSPQAFRARGIGRAVELLAAGTLAQPGELSGTLSGLTVIARTAPCRSVQPGHHRILAGQFGGSADRPLHFGPRGAAGEAGGRDFCPGGGNGRQAKGQRGE